MRKLLPFWIAVALLFSGQVLARGRTGTLAGTVIGTNGKPAANTAVMAERSDGRAPLATRTNSHGRYFFAFLPAGLYDVRASGRATASDWKHNVLVHPGRQTEVTLHLRRIKKRKSIPASQRRN